VDVLVWGEADASPSPTPRHRPQLQATTHLAGHTPPTLAGDQREFRADDIRLAWLELLRNFGHHSPAGTSVTSCERRTVGVELCDEITLRFEVVAVLSGDPMAVSPGAGRDLNIEHPARPLLGLGALATGAGRRCRPHRSKTTDEDGRSSVEREYVHQSARDEPTNQVSAAAIPDLSAEPARSPRTTSITVGAVITTGSPVLA